MKKQKIGVSIAYAGFAVISYILIANALSLIAVGLVNLFTIGSFSLTPLTVSDMTAALIEMLITVVSLGVPYLLFSKKGENWEFERPDRRFSAYALPFFFGVLSTTLFVTGYLTDIFEKLGYAWEVADITPDLTSWVSIALCFLRFAVIPAFFEELLFRGAILRRMTDEVGETAACLVSAALFTLLHPSPASWPGIFLLGWLFAYITVKTRSLIPAMLLHLLNNTIAVLSHIFAALPDERYSLYLVYAVLIAGGLAVWYGVSFFRRPDLQGLRALTKAPDRIAFLPFIPAIIVLAFQIYMVIATAVRV